MNDVGGSESGRGLRAVKSSRTSDSNFEYDDSEWDVGIGNLIIDLDADIEKTNEAATRSGGSSSNSSSGSTPVTAQQNLSRSSTLPSSSAPNSQMHIPQSPATTSTTTANNSNKGKSSTTATASGNSGVLPSTPSNSSGKLLSSPAASESFSSTNSVISVSMEHTTMSDKGLKMKIKRSKPGTKSVEARHEIVKSDVLTHTSGPTNTSSSTSLMKGQLSNDTKPTFSLSSLKDSKETKDKDWPQDTTTSQDLNSSKTKAAKRPTSTHKKVKLATGVTASIVSTKKEIGPSEAKSSSNPTTLNASLGNSNHGKDNFGPNNSSSLSNIGSAFAKTLTSSHIKLPNQGNILGSDLTTTNSAAGNTTNCRSLHNNSTSHNNSPSSQLTTSSPSKATDKTGTSTLNQSMEKGTSSSPSYGKKARVGAANSSEKNSSHDSTTSTPQNLSSTGSGSIGFPPLTYRNISSVGNETVTTSTGGTNFSTANATTVVQTTKDSIAAMNSRVPVQPVSFQDACVGTTVGTVTEPDCLGPCEPGTSVTLEGIVWHETESGVLVVNVTWRGKTYVGTLLDCTKSDWASPRFCDSPTSDLEMRTPKNRGKRGRAQTATPVSDPAIVDATKSSSAKLRNGAKGRRGATNAAFVAPVSPLKPDQWQKRKTRGSENESQEESTTTSKSTKRLKLNKDTSGRQGGSPAPSGTGESLGPYSPALIECPEPNCKKRYTHINGLRYHQTHAHSNNFAAEDSDSNLSTASNTNLNSVAESAGPNDDVSIEPRIDVDAIEASGAESNSAPTTPVKKQSTKPDVEDKEKGDDVVDFDLKGDEEKAPLHCKLTLTTTPLKEKEDTEKVVEKNDSPGSKERELPPTTGLSSRTPILTVPTLPFMSLQSRNQLHSLHRTTGNPEPSDKPNRDQESNVMGKIGTNTNVSAVPASKGISWQPHAISPFHTQQQQQQQQQNLNIPVTLNVPLGSSITSRDHDKGTKESKTSSSTLGSPTKKSKHKKKSKDKNDKERERDREGKPKLASDYMSRDNTIKPGLFSPTAIQREKERTFKGQDFSPQRDPDGGGSHAGENPQSPAYSDISDANDSGPESDMNLDGKEQTGKNPTGDLKKDGPGGQNLSSFYSPFYTPMESPYLSSSNPPPGQAKSERNSGGGGGGGGPGSGPPDDQGADKFKSKSSTSLPQHISAHMEDRRSSPKLDYHHQKYLSPQQHYFPYPYPNYHFDQGYAGLIPENSYSHNRSIIEEKERETEEQRVRLNSKGRMPTECIKEEPGVPTNLSSVKQDPGLDRGDSHRSAVLEDKTPSHPPEQKSNFPTDYQESKRHGASGMSPYGHSTQSKHPKESRREREERHGKEAEGKDSGKNPMRSSEQSRHKNMERERERESSNEKESKNEGAKPTMETQGPPPPPTAGSYAYYPPSYLQGAPYSLPFDPNHHIFRQVMVPSPYPGSPYMHPHAGNIPRFSQPTAPASLPEDLSRPNPAAPPAKALDLLQHHAAQYYASHKIHELQERALKSPSPQINANRENSGSNLSGPTNLSSTSASPIPSSGRGNIGSGASSTERKQPTDLTKEVKPSINNPLSGSSAGTESSRSPPSVHHVHTHMHSHTHIGYPIIPTVPPQYSPNLSHYGVLTNPAAAPPASVIPPFSSQKPS